MERNILIAGVCLFSMQIVILFLMGFIIVNEHKVKKQLLDIKKQEFRYKNKYSMIELLFREYIEQQDINKLVNGLFTLLYITPKGSGTNEQQKN